MPHDKCLVLGCRNMGARLCRPCTEFLSTGKPNRSAAHHLARAAAKPVYDALVIFTEAAESWHSFHLNTEIECEDNCKAIPAAREAIEAYQREARHGA